MTTSFTQSFRVGWGKVTSAPMPSPTASHTAIPSFERGGARHPEVNPGWDLIPESCLKHPFLSWAKFKYSCDIERNENKCNLFKIWSGIEKPCLQQRVKNVFTKDSGLRSVERVCLGSFYWHGTSNHSGIHSMTKHIGESSASGTGKEWKHPSLSCLRKICMQDSRCRRQIFFWKRSLEWKTRVRFTLLTLVCKIATCTHVGSFQTPSKPLENVTWPRSLGQHVIVENVTEKGSMAPSARGTCQLQELFFRWGKMKNILQAGCLCGLHDNGNVLDAIAIIV